MKKIFFMVGLFLIFQLQFILLLGQQERAVSQHSISPEKRAEWQTKLMTQQLKLTDTTFIAVYRINLRYEFISDSLQACGLDQLKRRETFDMYREFKNNALKTVLTPEQYQDWVNFRESMRNRVSENQQQTHHIKQ